MKQMLVSWKSITPIFADVLISPWNLLIGGLLVSKLNLLSALISSLLGYLILSLIFYFYGNLGFTYRKKTSELIEPIFGEYGTKIFFSTILALGQIGWFAIITQIGGESLANIFGSSYSIGIIIYAIAMFLTASLNLQKFALVKTFITISSIGLIVFLLTSNYKTIELNQLYESGFKGNIIWGVSIVVSSLISFTSVSPDFFSELRTKRDSIISILFGIFLPGFIIVSLGALLFTDNSTLSIERIIGISSLAFFGHFFNVITNTDAAQAIYTPGNRISYIFKTPFILSVGIATILGTLLSLLDISAHLETWLSMLAGVYPSIIGISLAYYIGLKTKRLNGNSHIIAMLIVFLGTLTILFLNVTTIVWIVGIVSFVAYIIYSYKK